MNALLSFQISKKNMIFCKVINNSIFCYHFVIIFVIILLSSLHHRACSFFMFVHVLTLHMIYSKHFLRNQPSQSNKKYLCKVNNSITQQTKNLLGKHTSQTHLSEYNSIKYMLKLLMLFFFSLKKWPD